MKLGKLRLLFDETDDYIDPNDIDGAEIILN